MKNIIVILTAIFCLTATSRAQQAQDSVSSFPTENAQVTTDVQAADQAAPAGNPAVSDMLRLWDAANNAYIDGDYDTAVKLYNQLLESGKHGAKLYYNLGNAYFKQNRLGCAILNYNRAQLLDPRDEDISYNLALANARTVDKIEDVPQFFLKTWIGGIGEFFNSNTWSILSLVFLGIGLGAVIMWLVARSLPLRKAGFYGAIAMAFLFISSLVYAQSARDRQINSRTGIVMNAAAPVKSSPSGTSKDIFVLHEGTKLTVHETLDGWYEISVADGNKGWISQQAVELIN